MNKGNVVRFDGLDVLKCLCAFWVVCVHCPFPGPFGFAIDVINKIAVPIFFMITGFFYSHTAKKGKELNQIKKIILLFLGSNIAYGILQFLFIASSSTTLSSYMAKFFNVKSIIKVVIFNESSVIFHTWYLMALIEALIYMLLFSKLFKSKNRNILYTISILVVIFSVLFGKYSKAILGKEYPIYISRNVYFVAIPYLVVGYTISKHFSKIKEKIKNIYLIIMILTFAIIGVLEKILLIKTNTIAENGDSYFSTFFLSISVFLLFTKITVDKNISKTSPKFKLWTALKTIGKKYSLWIYLAHPVCIFILQFLAQTLGIKKVYKNIAPIPVFICTLGIILLINIIKIRLTEINYSKLLNIKLGKSKKKTIPLRQK